MGKKTNKASISEKKTIDETKATNGKKSFESAEEHQEPVEIETPKPKTIEPDFHYKLKLYIANKKGIRTLTKPYIKILLTLPRIPEKLIDVAVDDEYFMVDTSRYTKKFFIEKPFPEGIKVQSDAQPIVKYDGNTLAIICLLQTPVPKEVDKKYFEIAKSVHESYKIKLGPAVQTKKKVVEKFEDLHKKIDKKRKRKDEERKFQEKQLQKEERDKLKREKKRRRAEDKKSAQEPQQ